MKNLEKINEIISNIKSNTIVKIEFSPSGQVIKRMEFLESLTKLLNGDNKDYLLKYQELVRE